MKIPVRRIVPLVILIVAAEAAWPQSQKQEPLRLIHADRLRSLERQGAKVRIVEGRVAFRQGDSRMTCDRAVWYVDEGRSVFRGNVVVETEETVLKAVEVTYYDSVRTTLATGDVYLLDDENILRADTLWYYEDADSALASGSVVMSDSTKRMLLSGERGEYIRGRDVVRMLRQPVYVQRDSLGSEELRIIADEMEIYDRGARSRAAGHVVITKDSTTAHCGEAEYFREEGHLALRQQPIAIQAGEEIRGDEMDLYMKDNALDWVEVLGNAQVISKIDTIPGKELENRLTGKRMELYLEHERLRRVVITGQAYSVYHAISDGDHTGTNEAIGDTMALRFDAGKLRQVIISSAPGKSTGRLFPPGGEPATPLSPTSAAKPVRAAEAPGDGGRNE